MFRSHKYHLLVLALALLALLSACSTGTQASPTTQRVTVTPGGSEPTGQPVEPTGQPDEPTGQPTTEPSTGGEIWIAGGNGLIAVSADGSIRTLLGADVAQSGFQVKASPDGSWIAAPGNSAQTAILLYNTASQQRSEIAQTVQIFNFVFSPDSRELAFSTVDFEAGWTLQVANLESGELRTLQRGAGNGPLLAPKLWTQAGLFAERILYASDAPPQKLTLVNPADGSITELTEGAHAQAQPSPDGRHLALSSGTMAIGEPPTTDFLLRDLSSGEDTLLIPRGQGYVPTIRWAPDSAKLVYTHLRDYSVTPSAYLIAGPGLDEPLSFDTAELPGKVVDLGWRNGETLVLLLSEQGELRLYELPLSDLSASGLRPLAALGIPGSGFGDQIVYVKGAE